jgi:hypothetical protein
VARLRDVQEEDEITGTGVVVSLLAVPNSLIHFLKGILFSIYFHSLRTLNTLSQKGSFDRKWCPAPVKKISSNGIDS